MARSRLHSPPPIPLLPPALLKRHHCFVSTDTRFRAAARLLQSLWRVDHRIGVGLHTSRAEGGSTPIKLGSRLEFKAARAGRNFISPEIFQLVRRELLMREEGAVIDVDRLFENALSSMPLCFNLLGPMALDLDLATAVWRRLLPGFVRCVENIGFEHSPGRGEARFLADGTAFDAVLRVVTTEGEQGVVFVEIKYSEGMTGPAAPQRQRYDEAARTVRLFKIPTARLFDLWRSNSCGANTCWPSSPSTTK